MSGLGLAMSTVLSQVAKLVKGLDDAQIEQLVSGETKIELLPKGAKVELPLDLYEVADRVRELDSEEQVVALLNADKRLAAPKLKELATELNIAVPPKARAKAALQLHIAQSMIGHRRRTYGGV